PVPLEVARVRSSEFRPQLLPKPYERGYPEETQSLLLGLLTSSRSVHAAKHALSKLGLSLSESELDGVASPFVTELELRNTRPIAPTRTYWPYSSMESTSKCETRNGFESTAFTLSSGCCATAKNASLHASLAPAERISRIGKRSCEVSSNGASGA